jgi:hypothetical protein
VQTALRDRTDVFIMALAPWVVAIPPAGADGWRESREGDDLGDDPRTVESPNPRDRLSKIF